MSPPPGSAEILPANESDGWKMIELANGNMTFSVERRFGVGDAERIRRTVNQVAPVREVLIDFSAAAVVDDAALLVVAEFMRSEPRCRFRLTGLTNHRRRLLRYMGVKDGLTLDRGRHDEDCVTAAIGQPIPAA